MYETGNGVEKNGHEAERWYLRAAGTGEAYVQFYVANFYPKTGGCRTPPNGCNGLQIRPMCQPYMR